MTLIQIILVIIFCAVASFFLYGIWLLENDRDEFRRKHGYDPKYHDWKVNDKDQDK
jgi:hypothetical protein